MIPILSCVGRRLSLALLLLSLALAAANAAPPSRDAIIPRLTVDAGDALPLVALDVNVVVRGHLSRTTYIATFRNDDGQDLNGRFFLPLPDGAAVTDMGLYFNGKLRHAVAVERERARVAYEAMVHRNVDPLLAEWSTRPGFNYEIYPIPAHGEKQVFIAFDRELRREGDDMLYDLDLRGNMPLRKLKVRVSADADGAIAIERDGVPAIETTQFYVVDEPDTTLDLAIRVAHRFRDREALVEWDSAESISYAAIPFALENRGPALAPAADVVVFWDASGSTTARGRRQLTEFLEAFVLRQAPFVAVTIVPFHVALETPIAFPRMARGEAAKRLRSTFDLMLHSGASDYQLLFESIPDLTRQLPRDARLVVAGDGLATTGAREHANAALERLRRGGRPLTIVSAAGDTDGRFLRAAAAASSGWYLPLGDVTPRDAVDDAMRAPGWFRIAAGENDEVAETGRNAVRNGMLLIANVRSQSSAPPVTLRYEAGGPVALEYTTRVVEGAPGLVRSAWARARLAALLGENGRDDDLAAHGVKYTLLTPRTSLIVLDSWRDYQAFGIPMPDDVKAIFEAETKPLRGTASVPPQMAPGSWFFRGRVTMDGSPVPGVTITALGPSSPTIRSISNADGLYWVVFPSRPAEAVTARFELEGLQSVTRIIRNDAPNGSFYEVQLRIAAVAEAITVTAASPAVLESGMTEGVRAGLQAGRGSIWEREECRECERLLRHVADVEALDELGDAALEYRGDWVDAIVAHLASLRTTSARLDFYTRARSHVGGSKRFHIRAAGALRKDDPALAIRVLTDAVEQNGDDAPFLRIVARMLENWGATEAALHLFERSTDVAPQQPQSWRELISARVRAGRTRGLDEIESRYRKAPLDRRFREIEQIFERELQQLKTSDGRAADAPDLEISCVWDSNYSYVDLWINEPDGGEVGWSNKKGSVGVFHGGFTEGFGPQVYEAPVATKGTYRVSLDYYSHDRTELNVEAVALVEMRLRDRGRLRVEHEAVFMEEHREKPEIAVVTVPGGIRITPPEARSRFANR